MKARKYRKIRKLLCDEFWLEERLMEVAKEFEKLNPFKTFECSKFFKGHLLAELNTKEYHKRYHKAWKKERQLKRLLLKLSKPTQSAEVNNE